MNEKILTPTLDKMLEIEDQSRICGEFLDFLQHKYAMFDKRVSREQFCYVGAGDYIDGEKVLAEFFEIDLDEAEREKNALLESIRRRN